MQGDPLEGARSVGEPRNDVDLQPATVGPDLRAGRFPGRILLPWS